MKRLLVLLALCLTSCMSGGAMQIATAVHQSSDVSGEGVIHALYVGPFPWTYEIRWRGTGTITFQYPAQPHVLLQGQFEWEPVIPSQLAAIQAEYAAGRFAVVEESR